MSASFTKSVIENDTLPCRGSETALSDGAQSFQSVQETRASGKGRIRNKTPVCSSSAMTTPMPTSKLPPKWREGQSFEGAFCVSRQISRHFGGIAVTGGSAFHHPGMKPPGIPSRTFTRTFCPDRAASSVLATILATKCRECRSAAPRNPAIYPAELAVCRYPDRKPDMMSGFAGDLGTTAHTDIG
jgi:hypothetical protein